MLEPTGRWDGKDQNYKFCIKGKSDSDYVKDPETRRRISGWRAFLNDGPCTWKSKMQKFVTLSVTEAECVAGTDCAQDMLFGKRFLESLSLQVELPMMLEMDNKGRVDIFNSWSIAGNARATPVWLAFIRELKEAGTLKIVWIQGDDNNADLHTNNLGGPEYEKHVSEYESVVSTAVKSNSACEEECQGGGKGDWKCDCQSHQTQVLGKLCLGKLYKIGLERMNSSREQR